mgnify:CR=1 FL=1
MRILIILSPTNKHGTKTEYTILRNFLKNDGYVRLSSDTYMRITTNRKGAEKHYRRLTTVAPKSGTVRILKLTERQFSNTWYLTGCTDYQEKIVGNSCHIML